MDAGTPPCPGRRPEERLAVLVTPVRNGVGDALVVLAVVLVVQQLEGNLLQPLTMGQAVHLHPVVTLLVVTCGTLLLGIPGAVLAVPLTAVAYRVAECLRVQHPGPDRGTGPE